MILLLPCEVGVKAISPAIRALIARTIVEKHGMKEQQAAEILGVSQSAISRYTSKNRGNTITIENVPEVQTLVEQMIYILMHNTHQNNKVLELFCQTCKIIREKGLICELCRQKAGSPDSETCDFCRSN